MLWLMPTPPKYGLNRLADKSPFFLYGYKERSQTTTPSLSNRTGFAKEPLQLPRPVQCCGLVPSSDAHTAHKHVRHCLPSRHDGERLLYRPPAS
mmetsp:Transcript_11608/g.28546  ORF Transcript_11608/g.28546 Transcript_11608/m.28546 type:complete len:94 (+) Transcript_11608:539-820(+)